MQERERQANRQAWEATITATKRQDLNIPNQTGEQNGWFFSGADNRNNLFYNLIKSDIILGLQEDSKFNTQNEINIAHRPIWFKEPTAYLQDISDRWAEISRKEKGSWKGQAFGFGTIGLNIVSIPVGFVESTFKLRESIIGQIELAKEVSTQPYETFGKVGEALERNPGDVMGKAWGMWLTGKITPKIIGGISRNVQKLSPSYIAPEATGINYVESTTIPTKLSELRKLKVPSPIPK